MSATLLLVPLSACAPSAERLGTGTAGDASGCVYEPSGTPAKPVDPPATDQVPTEGRVLFTLTTNEGDVRITMDRSRTPCSVNSFSALVQQSYFDDTQCHRLVDMGIFVLQCGDPTGTGRGGPGYRFADEVQPGDTYPAGTVAMANAGPDTNGSQFFLVYEDSELPPSYTVLGTMDAESTGVVARIAAEGHGGQPGEGTPNNEARIIRVTETAL